MAVENEALKLELMLAAKANTNSNDLRATCLHSFHLYFLFPYGMLNKREVVKMGGIKNILFDNPLIYIGLFVFMVGSILLSSSAFFLLPLLLLCAYYIISQMAFNSIFENVLMQVFLIVIIGYAFV